MRKVLKSRKIHVRGDWRKRAGFLFFPKICRNEAGHKELRWLEYAAWSQIYSSSGWTNGHWIDEEIDEHVPF